MNLTKNTWNKKDYKEFFNYLDTLKDLNYQKFHKKLLNTDTPIIGIRTPILKKISKEISKGNYKQFLELNSMYYYEEIILYGFIIGHIKELNPNLINYINYYISKIDSWATCDLFCSNLKIVKKNKEYFLNYIKENIKSPNSWMKRTCFVLLLSYYIEDEYLETIYNLTDNYNTKDYYVNMAIAWLLSICYIKYKDKTLNYLNRCKLDNFTYNKTIQKIIESTRISKEEKLKLKKLKK